MPLTAALPTLQTGIQTAIYNAAYTAMKSMMTTPKDANATVKAYLTAQSEKTAIDFATKFSQSVAPSLSQAIHSYVMSIGIVVIPNGTLVAPPTGGPVTGTVSTTLGSITVM